MVIPADFSSSSTVEMMQRRGTLTLPEAQPGSAECVGKLEKTVVDSEGHCHLTSSAIFTASDATGPAGEATGDIPKLLQGNLATTSKKRNTADGTKVNKNIKKS